MVFIFYVQYFFFWKLYRLWDNVENYGTARLATHDNTVLHTNDVLCMLDI